MNVALTSANQAKIEAVNSVFFKALGADIKIFPIISASEISETPLSDEEALIGCRKRMKGISSSNFDYIVSLEGLVQKYTYGWFLYGVAIVLDCANKEEGIGFSAKVQIPPKLSKLIQPDKKLSDLTKSIYSDERTKELSLIGTNGIITRGLYTRVDEFEGALRCALGFVLNKENYL